MFAYYPHMYLYLHLGKHDIKLFGHSRILNAIHEITFVHGYMYV